MNLDDLRIVVDEREKKSGIPKLLKTIGINLEIKTLPIGDYIVLPETIIERKSTTDFLSSLFDGRLFDQCHRLKNNFEFPIIIVEGNIDYIEKLAENPLIFYGALSSILLDFKIPVIYTPNAFHTAKLLISMSSRQGKIKGTFLKKIKKPHDIKKQQLSILCSLPGIGEKTATKLLCTFGSPLEIFTTSPINLSKVPGLNTSRIEKIKKILRTNYTRVDKNKQQKLNY